MEELGLVLQENLLEDFYPFVQLPEFVIKIGLLWCLAFLLDLKRGHLFEGIVAVQFGGLPLRGRPIDVSVTPLVEEIHDLVLGRGMRRQDLTLPHLYSTL